jgi:iron complex outermembrane recepter protein
MKKPLLSTQNLRKIMKISLQQILLACLLISGVNAHKSKAQDILDKSISFQAVDSEVGKILSQIEGMTDAQFVYSSKTIHADRKVSYKASNQKLSTVLNTLFSPLQISYKVYGSRIILSNESAVPNVASTQTVAVEQAGGTVKTTGGEPLPGVSILVKGTTRGTVTGVDGSYKIEANKGQTLIFSFIGYTTKEVIVGDASEINVNLEESATALSDVVVIGSRALPRTDVDRPVPVDVISAKELQGTGQVELGQMVQFNSPSFNSAKTGVNGVANFADPASLRGLSPDQVLVLVDGKRRHQFAGLNLNVTVGLGTVVTDLNAIPSLAVERMEVLRDGAAALYGSDAIAGVINLGLNKSVGKGTFKSQVGQTKMGDGLTYMGAVNYGFKLGKEKSYLNFTLQYQHANGTDRSDSYNPQPVTGGAYSGIYTNVKATDEAARTARGVWPAYGTFSPTIYGSNQTTAIQGFYNLGFPLANNWNLYSFGGISSKKIKAYGFFRVAVPGNANSTPEIFPDGYSPELPGETADYSTVVGLNKKVLNGWNLDFSAGYGYSLLDLFANNTTNPSMGAASPKDFYVGRNAFGQTTVEANVSKNYKGLMGTKSFNLAFGSQYRVDNFILKQGSAESYQVGPLALSKGKAPGSSGRPGIAPADETDAKRSNVGVYADIETDLTDKLLIATALRYENYSDFGSNVSGKFAARLKLSESFSLRASVNRGFRAPSLAQTFNSVTTSTVQAGAIIQTKQLPNSDPRLAQIGFSQPTAETSWNYNVGITAKVGNNLLFTLDGYQIDITDRIILAERMVVASNTVLKPLFPGISEIRFFTNHVNTTTKGIDLVTTFKHDFNSKNRLSVSLALTANSTKITGQRATPDVLQAGIKTPILVIDTVSISLIETAQPRKKAHLNISYQMGKVNLNWRTSYFGDVTGWEKPTGRPHINQTFGAKTLHDVAVSFAPNKTFSFTLGANNVTDVYPDRVDLKFASYSNGQIPFSRNVNQFGFNGAFYYLNASVNF